jgi:hypothetical protein
MAPCSLQIVAESSNIFALLQINTIFVMYTSSP